MPDGQTCFNVELVGDYFVASATGSVVRPFGPVKLKMRTWNSCQMLARQHLLPNLLSKADPEYKSIRRCVVLGVTTAKDDAVFGMPIKFMSVKQIEQEVKSNGIPIRVDMYPDIITLRSKLRMARENPERFKQSEQKHVQAFSKLGDAIDLNAGLFDKIRDEQNASPNLSTTSNSIKKRVTIGSIFCHPLLILINMDYSLGGLGCSIFFTYSSKLNPLK